MIKVTTMRDGVADQWWVNPVNIVRIWDWDGKTDPDGHRTVLELVDSAQGVVVESMADVVAAVDKWNSGMLLKAIDKWENPAVLVPLEMIPQGD